MNQKKITLNEYLSSKEAVIKEIPLLESEFLLQGDENPQEFKVRLFKIFSPGSKVSKISLVADKREVETAFLHRYIPEFEDEFFEPSSNPQLPGRNYIVKAYVFGKYLDDNVSIERGGFNFRKDREENGELYADICQTEIEREAAKLANTAFSGEVASRLERKKAIIQEYVEQQAPWHRETLKDVELNEFSMHPKPEEMEEILHRAQFKTETKLRVQVKNILDKEGPSEQSDETARAVAKNISEKSKSELIHYVALRKYLLDLLARNLSIVTMENTIQKVRSMTSFFQEKRIPTVFPTKDTTSGYWMSALALLTTSPLTFHSMAATQTEEM